MACPTDEEIADVLVHIISDGFNRSLSALESAGAVNAKKMRAQYSGIGSKYYDLVTVQIEMTARVGAGKMRQLFNEIDEPNVKKK